MKKNSIFIPLFLMGISIILYFSLFFIDTPSYTINIVQTIFWIGIYSFPIIICYNLHNGKHVILSDIGTMICLFTCIYCIGIIWELISKDNVYYYLVGITIVVSYISFMLLQMPSNKFVYVLRYFGIVLISILYPLYIFISFKFIELVYIIFVILLILLAIVTLLIIFINMINNHKGKRIDKTNTVDNELNILKQKLIMGSISEDEYRVEKNRILYK